MATNQNGANYGGQFAIDASSSTWWPMLELMDDDMRHHMVAKSSACKWQVAPSGCQNLRLIQMAPSGDQICN